MARSCAAWDDNNKDNVCKSNIPAGIKCPPTSKTISVITWFGTILNTLLNAKSPRFDPNIAEGLDQWPENMPLGVQPTMQELTVAIHSLANGKAVGPDGVSVELFKITLNGDPALRQRRLDIVVRIWRGGEVPKQCKDAIIMVLRKMINRTECGN